MRRRSFVCLALLIAAPASAQQIFETVGSRALGMGGAFVGVADDATAVYWNPAGLATGSPPGATIEWVRLRTRDQKATPESGASARNSHFVSLGTWPLGLSYASLNTTELTPGVNGTLQAASLRTRQFGLTFMQTLVPGVTVGSTLKYVRGTTALEAAEGVTTGDALKKGEELKGSTTGAFDLDIGVMADLHWVRVGVTSRNLRQPRFGKIAESSVQLKRQTRAGISLLPVNGLTLAIDVDLNTVDLRDGLRRMIAFGGEGRLSSRLMVRTGMRWNLKAERQRVVAGGLSIMLRPRMWLDVHYTQGRLDLDRGYGIALRAGL